MHIEFRNRYEPDHGARLNERMMEAFGFSFQPWFERGHWDGRYESHSVVDGGRMLANAGVYHTDLVSGGRRVRALQIGAVATAADARGNGHQRRLFEHIFSMHGGLPAFLHANESVTQFYPKLGFVRAFEWRPTVDARIDSDAEPLRVPMDDPAFARALRARGPLSCALDCAGTEPVAWFHLLLEYGEHIYPLREPGAYVLAVRDGASLLLADVISPRPIPFSALRAQLPFRGIESVEFGFTPDLLGVAPQWTRIDDDGCALFVRGALPLPDRFRIPIASVT